MGDSILGSNAIATLGAETSILSELAMILFKKSGALSTARVIQIEGLK